MNRIFETPNLRLRHFTEDDAAFIIRLLNTPGWIKYIGNRNVTNTDEARAYLENSIFRSYRENGYGLSLVEKKTNGEPIGMCGFVKRTGMENPDIGFAFLPEYTGKGFALEMAGATLFHATHYLRIHVIDAITDPENKRSINLLEKLDFRFLKTIRLHGEAVDLNFYRYRI